MAVVQARLRRTLEDARARLISLTDHPLHPVQGEWELVLVVLHSDRQDLQHSGHQVALRRMERRWG